MARAPRYYFRDEEPEDENPWLDYGRDSICQFCGHKQHRDADGKVVRCPSKPML